MYWHTKQHNWNLNVFTFWIDNICIGTLVCELAAWRGGKTSPDLTIGEAHMYWHSNVPD